MKYLKRLKNELLDLDTKLSVKGHLPEYVRSLHVNRQTVIRMVIEVVKRARDIDFSTDNWGIATEEAWTKFNTEMAQWVALMPKPPKAVDKKASAA